MPMFLLILIVLGFARLSESSIDALDRAANGGGGVGRRRALLGFKETPRGSNLTFECSPSGPCVLCEYSEKNDVKYRCSETGYRIPMKCVEMKDDKKSESVKKSQNRRSVSEISDNNEDPRGLLHDTVSYTHRNLMGDSSAVEGGSQAYVTYRSCILPVNEEKLSVIGFEGIILCLLLVSGSMVYFRRKRSVTVSGVGAGRIQTNSRF
uniref:Structural polyprotein n=1 Tax=Rhizophora mucronata TaxID=61149 RepID=A0A2P2IVW9_RHIMU